MNASLTNTTSSCPSFLAGLYNATGSYCALPICANTTAVMAQCCADSEVFPYHSVAGPDSSGFDNITDLNALWCQVDNSSIPAWLSCVSDVSAVGLCSAPLADQEQEGWARRSVAVGAKMAVGLAAVVALFHGML